MPRPDDAVRPPLPPPGIVIGKVLGIELAIHPSWLITFGLLTVFTRYEVAPKLAPYHVDAVQWGLAIVIAGAFAASVLVHELCHSVVAKMYGLEARRITLFLFGGVSQVSSEPSRPAAEFFIALAGPLASLVMAGAMAATSRLLHPHMTGLPGAWGTLALVNMALAAFNLIPGFPLDGGRILRSALWAHFRDRARATRIASYGGRATALALVGVGVGFFVSSGGDGEALVGGFWYVLLGWFLYGAVDSAARVEGTKALLSGPAPDTLDGDESKAAESYARR
jgi:Zn-dependent protease